MIKYFCDRCGKECDKDARTIQRFAYDSLGVGVVWLRNDHLCKECNEIFEEVHDKLKHEDDIFDMTDKEIELLRYAFNVGDKVIASDGRTGTITHICTCDKCKKRGFYEPTVDFGDYTGYITISEKDDGFKSYYQIGDRVFGNLDEETVNKEVDEYKKKLLKLYEQLGLITNLKQLKEMHHGN